MFKLILVLLLWVSPSLADTVDVVIRPNGDAGTIDATWNPWTNYLFHDEVVINPSAGTCGASEQNATADKNDSNDKSGFTMETNPVRKLRYITNLQTNSYIRDDGEGPGQVFVRVNSVEETPVSSSSSTLAWQTKNFSTGWTFSEFMAELIGAHISPSLTNGENGETLCTFYILATGQRRRIGS